jgi:hypothetical protein
MNSLFDADRLLFNLKNELLPSQRAEVVRQLRTCQPLLRTQAVQACGRLACLSASQRNILRVLVSVLPVRRIIHQLSRENKLFADCLAAQEEHHVDRLSIS